MTAEAVVLSEEYELLVLLEAAFLMLLTGLEPAQEDVSVGTLLVADVVFSCALF